MFLATVYEPTVPSEKDSVSRILHYIIVSFFEKNSDSLQLYERHSLGIFEVDECSSEIDK